jgi:solute carrier family 35 protein F5
VATAKAACAIAPRYFLAQLCFNYSLLYTSVTNNSILSTSSSVFTFALSAWIVKARSVSRRSPYERVGVVNFIP